MPDPVQFPLNSITSSKSSLSTPQNQKYVPSPQLYSDDLASDEKKHKDNIQKTQLIDKSAKIHPQQAFTVSEIRQSPEYANIFYSQFFSCLPSNVSAMNYENLDKKYGHILKKNNIWVSDDNDVAISVPYRSKHSKVMTLIVQIAHFSVQLEVYQDSQDWFDQFIKQQGDTLGSGSEGMVIRLKEFQCVLKQYHIEKFRHTIFLYTVFQCAIAKLASCFEIGPKLMRPFMFDIYCTKKHMYFFMEECFKLIDMLDFLKIESESVQKEMEASALCEEIQIELKKSLYLLHRMQIIHFDIKPQNIMFSPAYNKYVLIDYGMAESKHFLRVQMELEQFRGTFCYASEQMRELLIDRKSVHVDAYFNDCVCLNKSLTILRESFHQKADSESSSYLELSVSRQSNIGVTEYLRRRNEHLLDQSYESGKEMRHVDDFESFHGQNIFTNQPYFIANSFPIYVTYFLYQKMYATIEKLFVKTESIVMQNFDSVLGCFFEIGLKCYESEAFVQFVKNLEENQFSSKASKKNIDRLNNQKKFKYDYDSHTEEMFQKYPSIAILYEQYVQKNDQSAKLNKETSDYDSQSIKLLDLKSAIVNRKSIFFCNFIPASERLKSDRIYETYDLIDSYIKIMHDKLCLDYIDLSREVRLASVFVSIEGILSRLSLVEPSYLPYYQKLVLQSSREGKSNVLRDSLDLVFEHIQNGQTIQHIRKIEKSGQLIERSSKLSEVLFRLGKEDCINEIEQIVERRKVEHFFFKCQELIELIRRLNEGQNLSRIGNEDINRCQYLCYFLGSMHQYLTDRCLILLQTVAMSEGIDKIRGQITMNQTYFKKYEQFLVDLDPLLQKACHQYKVSSLDRFSEVKRLFSEGFPLIVDNSKSDQTKKFYLKFEELVEGRFFGKWSIQVLEPKIGQFYVDLSEIYSTYGKNLLLMEDFVVETLRQFLFKMLYKCCIQARRFYKAINLLEVQIVASEKIFRIGDNYKNFRVPLSSYYADLLKLNARLGLRHKAKEVLSLLRKLHQQDALEKLYYTAASQIFLHQDQSYLLTYYQNFYEKEDQRKTQQQKSQTSSDKKELLSILNRFLHQTKSQSPSVNKLLSVSIKKLEILDTLILNDKGLAIGQSIIKPCADNNFIDILIKFWKLIAKQLQANSWGGTKAIVKFLNFYIEPALEFFFQQKPINSKCEYQLEKNENTNIREQALSFRGSQVLEILKIINRLSVFKLNPYQEGSDEKRRKVCEKKQEQQVKAQKSGFLLAWCVANGMISVFSDFFHRSIVGNDDRQYAFPWQNKYTQKYQPIQFVSSLTGNQKNPQFFIRLEEISQLHRLMRKCVIWIYKCRLYEQAKIDSSKCTHKTPTQLFNQKDIDIKCPKCLQTLVTSYQEVDYVLTKRTIHVYDLFHVYMSTLFGTFFYFRLKFIWETLRNASFQLKFHLFSISVLMNTINSDYDQRQF